MFISGFKELGKLRRHTLTHTGERDFHCKYCNKAFSLKHNLKTHEKIHTGQGQYCRFCGRMYTQLPNLKTHEKLHMKKKHKETKDVELMKRQILVSKRGRPSLAEKYIYDEPSETKKDETTKTMEDNDEDVDEPKAPDENEKSTETTDVEIEK